MPLDAHLNCDEPVLESKSPDPDRFLARGDIEASVASAGAI